MPSHPVYGSLFSLVFDSEDNLHPLSDNSICLRRYVLSHCSDSPRLMKSLGMKSGRGLPTLRLAASMALLSAPVTAAPELSMTRSDGSEVIRNARVVTWGQQIDGTVAPGTSVFENVASIYAANNVTVAVLQNGSVGVTGSVSQNEKVGVATLTDVKAAVRGKACRTDGSVIEWTTGTFSYSVRPGLTGVTALSAGTFHTLALKNDGSVVAWGNDPQAFGLLQVPAGLGGVVAIDSSNSHNVALKSDGTVVAWGLNTSGQCNVPAGLTGVTAVSAGEGFSVALKNDGTLMGWGNGTYGQLTPPANLGPVSAIATGGAFTAALKSDKTVAAWGYSGDYNTTYGQLTFPPYLGRVSAIACGNYHTSAITDRPIEAFRDVGRHVSATKTFTIQNTGSDPLHLGNILNTGANAAEFVLNLSGWTPVVAPGGSTTFTVTFTPSAYGLRSTVLKIPNDDPDEGDWDIALTGFGVNSPPVATNLDSVVVVEDSVEGVEFDLPVTDPNGDPMTFSILADWEYDLQSLGGKRYRFRPDKDFAGQKILSFVAKDYYSEESNRGYVTITVTPVNDVPFLTVPRETITAMSTSPDGAHVSFMTGAGDVEDGLLQPVLTVGGQPVSSGSLFAIGEHLVEASVTDSEGATVTKSFTIRVVAAPAMTLEDSGAELKERRILAARGAYSSTGQGTVPSGVSEVVDIAAGGDQSIVALPDGTIRSWGGSSRMSQIPAGMSGVVKVATDGYHALALKSDGTVVGWGGYGTGWFVPPDGLTGVIDIAAGSSHSLALKSDGTVVAWGSSEYAQTTVPAGLDQVVRIAAGGNCSLALRRDGTVVAWGNDFYGRQTPPSWLAGVVGISVGQRHCLALRADGTIVGWGLQEYGTTEAPAGLGPVVFAEAGAQRSTVIQADGKIIDWGYYTPLAQDAFTNAKEIAWGEYHILAMQGAPALFSWGSVIPFGPNAKVMTVRNNGTGPLNISSISVEGGLPGEFVPDTSAMASTLAPGASTSFIVNFSPKAPGLREAKLRILSNDIAGETREVLLSGTWVNSAPVVTPVGPLALDEDQPGGIEITLPGSDVNGNPLSFSIVSPPSAAQGSLGPVTGNKVTFTPALDFNGTATFSFKANDGFLDSNVATVTLTVSPLDDTPRLTIPTEPVLVQSWTTDGAIAEFLAYAVDPEEGRVNAVVTVGGVPVRSGSFFPPGDTEVVVTATDSTGQTVTSSFIVRVVAGPKLVIETTEGLLPQQSTALAWGRNTWGESTVPASIGPVTAVAAGPGLSLALRPDGKVVSWGASTASAITVPATLSGVTAITAGWSHAVALKSDGTVVAWGSNTYGQCTVPAGLAGVVAIDAGDYFTLALKQDGTVVGWGRNDSGEVSIPAGLADVIAISGGGDHSLALKRDGTVVAWGSNSIGQATVPAGLVAVRSIAAGGSHSVALRQDGTVVAWGSNSGGKTTVPAGLPKVKQIATGNNHTLALTLDGAVVGWGVNTAGQLTVHSDPGRIEAIAGGSEHSVAIGKIAAPLDYGVLFQSANSVKTLTLRNDGPADLVFGQTGITSGDASQFSIVQGPTVPILASGESTTMKVAFQPTSNGTKKATLTIRSNQGDHPVRQLALTGHGRNGSPVATNVSRSVGEDPTNGLSITLSATDLESDALTFRILDSSAAGGTLGSVVGNTVTYYPASDFNGVFTFSFVANDGGTDSNVGTVTVTVTPVNDVPVISYLPSSIRVTTPLAGGTTVSFRQPTISDVEDGSVAPQLRLSNGTVIDSSYIFPVGTTTLQVRGTDSGGRTVTGSLPITVESVTGSAMQLEGPSGTPLFRKPAVVSWTTNTQISTEIPPELRGVNQITAGPDYGIALRNDGTLLGWGGSSQSKLNFPAGLVTATKVRAGTTFAMALRADGTVAAWGANTNGELTLPTLSGVSDIAAGASHGVACKSDGTLVGWGLNDYGQRTIPAGLTGVTTVAAGTSHTLALKSDGTVTCWGSNSYGLRTIPAGLSGVTAIAAGAYHNLALKSDGTVVAWGRSPERQTSVPPSLSGVVAIAAGQYHSMAMKSDGTVVTWGYYSVSGPPITSVPAQVSSVQSIAGGSSLMAAVNHPAETALGQVPTSGQATQIVTVRNRGNAALTLSGITRISGSEDFAVETSSMAASVASGQTTTFTIAFNPTSSGPKTARFRIASNDRYEPAYDVTVSGEGVSPFHAWAATAGLGETGVNPEAAPHGDGVASLLKYAFNMNGSAADTHALISGTGTSGLPFISLQQEAGGNFLRVEFLRRRSGGLDYIPARSTSLGASSFVPMVAVPEVTLIDSEWERVVVREAVELSTTPRIFGRVEVRMK